MRHDYETLPRFRIRQITNIRYYLPNYCIGVPRKCNGAKIENNLYLDCV